MSRLSKSHDDRHAARALPALCPRRGWDRAPTDCREDGSWYSRHPMTGAVRRLVGRSAWRAIVTLTIAASACTAVVAVATPEPAVAATTDLLVGDSVMAGMGSSSRSVLPNHVFDAKVCRRLVATSCTYQGVRPATALDVIRAYAGTTNRAIVVGAGYNDGSVGGAVDAIVTEARRQGIDHVVWLTYRAAGRNAGLYRSHNSVLRQKASAYPELRIADWAWYSAGRSDWVASDGLHLNGSGARALAGLIANTLASLPSPPPPGPPPLPPGARECFSTGGEATWGVLINLTPVSAAGAGHGTLTASTGSARAETSNVNFDSGTVDPNLAVAPADAAGRVCFRNSVHSSVHIVADELGAIAPGAYTPARPDGSTDRRVDTRLTRERVAAGGQHCFAVAGSPGDAAIVNLTPVRAAAAGHGTLMTSGVDASPVGSSVNYRPGTVDPNLSIAVIGNDGQVCFHVSRHASVDLVADQLGTLAAGSFTAATPEGTADRRIDTRLSARPVPADGKVCFGVGGRPGDAALVNLTPVLPSAPGHGLLTTSGIEAPPTASNVNYRPGTVDPNVAVAAVGRDGRVCFHASSHASAHLVADVFGTIGAEWFRWPGDDGAPVRRVDTRR